MDDRHYSFDAGARSQGGLIAHFKMCSMILRQLWPEAEIGPRSILA
jgi:hypothetical protein